MKYELFQLETAEGKRDTEPKYLVFTFMSSSKGGQALRLRPLLNNMILHPLSARNPGCVSCYM